jgi:hypothetical protein
MSAEDKKAMKRCLKRTTISRKTLWKKLHKAEEETVKPLLGDLHDTRSSNSGPNTNSSLTD